MAGGEVRAVGHAAAGTGSANFAQQLGEGVPHQAVGGYHVMMGHPSVALETPLLPMDFRFAITPMRGGIRLAGTYDFGAYGQPPNYRLLDDMWASICGNAEPDAGQAQALNAASLALVSAGRNAVDTLYPYCGLHAADARSAINRVWRDLHTATQHAMLAPLQGG